MDDETKLLLSEIRDAVVRLETGRRRFMLAWSIVIVLAGCVIGILFLRSEHKVQEAEEAERASTVRSVRGAR